jgi:ABC-2 type transport system permease protein
MKEIKAFFVVNAKEFLRDRMSVILVLLLPVGFVSFFGLIFGGVDGSWSLQLGIVNEDAGPAGEQFLEGLRAPELEEVIGVQIGSRADMERALHNGDVGLVLVLPAEMSALLGAGQQTTVEVLYDSSRADSAGTGLSMVQNMLSEANLTLSGAPHLLVMEARSVQTASLRTIDLQMPGMLGVALLWLGLFGTALPLAQQRATQVLRRLSVTPLRPASLLTAHIGWRVTVGLLQAGLFLLVGYFAFGVGVDGSKLSFVAAVVLGALVFVSLGYLLADLVPSVEGLMAVTQLVNFPMMFLCGGLFPIETLPSFLKPIANFLPLTYLTDAFKQLMVGAPPLHPLWLDYAVLAGCFTVFLVLGVRFWRWD